eukprot:3070199-Rhodomonas_salina.2
MVAVDFTAPADHPTQNSVVMYVEFGTTQMFVKEEKVPAGAAGTLLFRTEKTYKGKDLSFRCTLLPAHALAAPRLTERMVACQICCKPRIRGESGRGWPALVGQS